MREKYCVDANIFIGAWNNSYRPRSFPTLWEQIAQHRKDIVLIKPIYDQIDPISASDNKLNQAKKAEKYPLRMWLEKNGFEATLIGDEVQKLSLILEKEYQTTNKSKGADLNDITLIAYAETMEKTVVTFEGIGKHRYPGEKHNYKIPLICKERNVDCIDFVGLLEECNIRI